MLPVFNLLEAVLAFCQSVFKFVSSCRTPRCSSKVTPRSNTRNKSFVYTKNTRFFNSSLGVIPHNARTQWSGSVVVNVSHPVNAFCRSSPSGLCSWLTQTMIRRWLCVSHLTTSQTRSNQVFALCPYLSRCLLSPRVCFMHCISTSAT